MCAVDLSDELLACQFGDARLNKRAAKIAHHLGLKPNVSIPAAMKTRADLEACYRFFDNENVTPAEKSTKRRKTPIGEKESYRWLEGLQMANQAAQACPQTTCVCVGDSESDIYDLFVAANNMSETPNLHLLVRAGQNRNTTDKEDWKNQVRLSAKVGKQTTSIRARQAKIGQGKSARSRSRVARTAELEIRKATIQVARPAHDASTLPKFVKVNVVLCEEINPPEGEDPIC